MPSRISLKLVGAILAPTVLVAFVLGLVVAGVLNLSPSPAVARDDVLQPVAVPLPSGEESPFAAVADAVLPTVVNISAEKTVTTTRRSFDPGPFEEFFRDFFRELPEAPYQQQRSALGSGVIIDPAGYIVTNNHVIEGFDDIVVTLSDDTEFKGEKVEVVGRDPKTDLAVLRVKDAGSLPAIRFGDAPEIRVGDWAIAIGNALGLRSTVTVGVVSATGRSGIPLPEGPSYQDFIQTDASINPGNSGGPLVNIRGELIGINSAIRSPVGYNIGVGFAVPVDMVKVVTEQLIDHGKVIRGFLGIRPQPVDEALRDALGLEDTRGVLVSEVLADMPAEQAGVEDGDVIVRVDDVEIEDLEQFRRLVAAYAPNTTVRLTLVRDGRRLTKRVTLIEFPEDEQVSARVPEEPEEWLGLSVATHDGGGVVVSSVAAGSAAADAGIERGDVILEIGDREVGGLADYNRAAEEVGTGDDPVLVRIMRGSSKIYVAVDPSG